MAVSAAILLPAVCVIDVMNKDRMYSLSLSF